MKRIEIIQDETTDRNIFFFYDGTELVGLNFHYGIDATDDTGGFDSDYAINNKRLFDLYCEIQNESVPIGVNMKFDKVAVANEAIGKFLIINNEDFRKDIIEDEIEMAMYQVLNNCHARCFTKSSNITLKQTMRLTEIKLDLKSLLTMQINQNLK